MYSNIFVKGPNTVVHDTHLFTLFIKHISALLIVLRYMHLLIGFFYFMLSLISYQVSFKSFYLYIFGLFRIFKMFKIYCDLLLTFLGFVDEISNNQSIFLLEILKLYQYFTLFIRIWYISDDG